MRDILQGFTLYVAGVDHGIDCEEITLPQPKAVMQKYRGGGMDLEVDLAMAGLDALEAKFKFAGHSRDILKQLVTGPTKFLTVTARAAVMNPLEGTTQAHVIVLNGKFNESNRDAWKRTDKGGMEVTMSSIITYRYEIDNAVVHDIQAYPPRRVINGINELSEINSILGYAN